MADNKDESQVEQQRSNYLATLRDPVTHRFRAVTARQFVECWQHYDQDNSGYLEGEELDGFFREFIGSVVPDHSVGSEAVSSSALELLKAEFMDAYDDNQDGRIDFSELVQILPADETFVALFQQKTKLSSSVEFMKAWKSVDKDDSGFIEFEELKVFLKQILNSAKLEVTDEKLDEYTQTCLKLFDRDGDGKLRLSEMARLLPVKENYLIKPIFQSTRNVNSITVERIFKKYDTDNSGVLEGEELLGLLKDVLEASGVEFDVSSLQNIKEAIMEQWDTDHDGKIDKDELMEFLQYTLKLSQEARAMQRNL